MAQACHQAYTQGPANEIRMWGESRPELRPLPAPRPLPLPPGEKCRAVVWQPRSLETAPVDRVSLEESRMRACISVPAPKMWSRRGWPTRTRAAGQSVRTRKNRCHGASCVHTPPTPGTGQEDRERRAGNSRPCLSAEQVNTPRPPVPKGQGPAWCCQEAIAALRPHWSLCPWHRGLPVTGDATAWGFGQASARSACTCCPVETCLTGPSCCVLTEIAPHGPRATRASHA